MASLNPVAPPQPVGVTQLPNISKPHTIDGLTQPQGSPLEALVDNKADSPPSDPDFINRTARMGALINANGVDVGAQVESDTEFLKHQIEILGDDGLRAHAAAKLSERNFQGLVNLANSPADTDPGMSDAARQAAGHVIADGIEKKKAYALEQLAIEQIQDLAVSDPTQARVRIGNLERGSAEDVIRDINVKKMILDREIQKAQIAKDDQNWFLGAADFLLQVLPFNYSEGDIGNVDTPGLLKEWSDHILPGRRQRAEAASLWDMPVDRFSDFVANKLIPNVHENSTLLGFYDKTEALNHLTNLRSTPVSEEVNTYAVIDNFGALVGTPLSKAALSIPKMMIVNGARKQAGEAVARALTVGATEGAEVMAAKTGISAAEVADNALVSAVNPTPATTIPISTEATTAIERGQKLLGRIQEMLLPTDRFVNKEELSAAVDAEAQRISKEFGRDLVDVKPIDVPIANGSVVRDLELTVGKKSGGGFARERDANNWLANTGETGSVVRDESGQYFVKIKKNMSETGYYTVGIKPNSRTFMGIPTNNPIMDTILNARLVGDLTLADMAQVGGGKLNKVLKEVTQPLQERMNKISSKAKGDLAAILAAGEKRGIWWDDEQLAGIYERSYKRDITPHELDAYRAYKDANDIEFYLRNEDLYLQKHIRGFESASIEGVGRDRNALVNRNMSSVPKGRVYNIEDKIHYTKGNPLSQDKLDALKSQGYVLVSLEEATKVGDGTIIKNFLVKAKNAQFGPLNRNQLAYKAGGHRFYKGKYFSKQAVKRIQPDTKEDFLDSPNTYITGTKAEVAKWNSHMEAARNAYNRILTHDGTVDPEILDDLLDAGNPGLPSGEDFVKMIENGKIEKDTPFHTLFDREMPPEYTGIDPDDITFNESESGFNGWVRSNGRMYYSGKGEVLPDWRGEAAPLLDPFEAINKSLVNIANLSSFGDYKASAVARWVKTFEGQGLKGFNDGASDMTKFSDGSFDKNTKFEISQSAEKQRQLIKRTIGWQTSADIASEQQARRVISWINGDNPEGVRNWVAGKAQNWWDNNNFIGAMRAFAFDTKLGLFNPAQLPLQMSTMYSIMTLSPKYAMTAMRNLVPLRLYLTKSGTEHGLDELIRRGVHTASGFKDPAEFKAFMKYAKGSGFLDIGGTHQAVNSWGPNAALSDTGNVVNKVRETGRFFFNEGELSNRMVATQVAWRETREQFPHLDFKSPEFIRRWQGRGEEYGFNMSAQSAAWWQKGVMSIPTQFWAYQARTIEALLGNTFTPAQRARLAVGQLFLYGSAGLPFAGFISDKIKQHNGDAPDIDTFWGAMDRGALDEMIYHVTGQDVAVGKKFATGNWLTDTVADLMGQSAYGEKSMVETYGGATFNTIFNAAGATGQLIRDVVKYTDAESGGKMENPVLEQDIVRLASTVSSLSNAHKAYMVAKYGEYMSTKGQVLADSLPSATSFYIMMFGAQPGVQEELSARLAYSKNKKLIAEDAAKVIMSYRTRMLNEPQNVDEISNQLSMYTRMLDPADRKAALRKVYKDTNPSLYSSLVERTDQRQREEDQIKEMENQ